MALVVTSIESGVAGNKRVNRGKLALDASYPAGGYPVTPNRLGLSVIEFFEANPQQGYALAFDPVAVTIRVFALSSLSLVGSQTVGDAVQISGGVLGKTTAGNVTPTPVEVTTGTNLAAVTNVLWRAEGV